jgi:hypothetical protein
MEATGRQKEAESKLYQVIVECKMIAEGNQLITPTVEHIKTLWELYQVATGEEMELAAKVHEYECKEERYD